MKVTVITRKNKNRKKEKKSLYTNPYFFSLVILFLGILLLFHSKELISLIFSIFGILFLIYGIYKFIQYQKAKEVVSFFNGPYLYSAIIYFVLGLIFILFSRVFATMIQIVSGIWLAFVGLEKINTANLLKDHNSKAFFTNLITGLLMILLGIYTFLADNIVFMFIGAAMILYSILDIYHTWKK